MTPVGPGGGRAALLGALAALGGACDGGTCPGASCPGPGTFAGGFDGGVTTGSVTVTGTVSYDLVPAGYDPATGTGALRFAAAEARPVRRAAVVVVQGTTTIGQAFTADDGTFAVAFTPSGAGALTLHALAATASPPLRVQDNTSGGAVWALSTPLSGAAQVVALHATHGWSGAAYLPSARQAGPFAILDALETAARAFLAARPALALPPLACNWSPRNAPQAGDPAQGQIGTSYYDSSLRQLFILGKDQVDTDEYDAHVIVHEWGHYLEDRLSRSDSPGGPHSIGDQLDPRLALSEGWGDAVGAMVLPETVYADTAWTARGQTAFGFDVEQERSDGKGGVADDPSPGFWSESSLMRFLLDVEDGKNEAFDQVAVGLGPVIDVLTGPQRDTPALTTVASFVAGLKATDAGAAAGAALDTLAAHYRLGAITTAWGDGNPDLRAMYTTVDALPLADAAWSLTGGQPPQSAAQHHYYAFTGTGAPVTVSAQSARDVAVEAFRSGASQGAADSLDTGGTEEFSMSTLPGATYVVAITGYATSGGLYTVTVNLR